MARCPDDLLAALQEGIREGIAKGAPRENSVEVIAGPNRPLFISRPDLTKRVLHELRHYAETWAQVPLTPYRAYGFRAYTNESQLYMHVDKMQTHIVSFILHIDSSEDAGKCFYHLDVSMFQTVKLLNCLKPFFIAAFPLDHLPGYFYADRALADLHRR